MDQVITRISHTRDAAALRAACGREGCPVCTVVMEEMERAMASWNYEGFSDVLHRHDLIRSHGFCPRHTWQVAQRPNAFQLGVVYQDILTDLLTSYEQKIYHLTHLHEVSHAVSHRSMALSAIKTWWQWLVSLFYPIVPVIDPVSLSLDCPFCRTQTRLEERVVETFVTMLVLEETQALFRQSTGLCRLHLEQALAFAERQSEAHPQIVLTCQSACLERILAEVREQVRKHDYRYADEPRGNEMTAWRRAAVLCAGNQGVH